MSRIIIYPYKMGSASARLLSSGLNALRVRPDGRYLPRRGDLVVNWGNSSQPGWMASLRSILGLPGGARLLNRPENVAIASNKLSTFRVLQEAGVSIPGWTTARDVANVWMVDRHSVYCRTILTGHSGAGIIVADGSIEYATLPNARLYVKNIENHGEYRVHVFNGEVIDYQKKRRHHQDEPTQAQSEVRNLANGWIFTRENLRRLERIERIAVDAVAALGLDFASVDIIKNQDGDVFVLEVNTACGMSDTTLQAYVAAISTYQNNVNQNA